MQTQLDAETIACFKSATQRIGKGFDNAVTHNEKMKSDRKNKPPKSKSPQRKNEVKNE